MHTETIGQNIELPKRASTATRRDDSPLPLIAKLSFGLR